MRRAELLALCVVLAAPIARAQDSTMAHAKHMAWGRTAFLLVDELETRSPFAAKESSVDLMGWIGGATRRIWFKANGDAPWGELQVLYGQLIAPYWDLQLGAKVDTRFDLLNPKRGVAAVLGVQGLAPGWFDVESALLLDTDARLTAQFTASHDLYLTQRLIVQPRVETSWAARPDRDVGVGAGLGETELGLRLRYELRRELAPYVGVVWERAFGETARLIGTGGRPQAAAGVRLWF